MSHILRSALCLAVLCIGVAATPSALAETGVETTAQAHHTKAQGLLGVGFGIQATGLGFAIAELGLNNGMTETREARLFSLGGTWVAEGTGAGYAPVMIHGFSLAFDDGSKASRLRGTSFGLFQGAWHASAVAGVHGISLAVAAKRDRDRRDVVCAIDEGSPACWEGPGPFVLYVQIISSHLIVATGMAIGGLVTALAARHVDARAARVGHRAPFAVVHPITLRSGAGLGVTGTF